MTEEKSPNHNAQKLTQREKEILYCLARGESNDEIAVALNIEECTVRQHLQNLSKKLEVQGRGKLQAWAWRHGFGENGEKE